MSVTAFIPQAPPDAYTLDELLTALIDLRAFYLTHENAPRPGGPGGMVLQIGVPGQGRRERLASLAVIAEALGAQETRFGGAVVARRSFWPFVLEASVQDDEPGTTLAAVTGSGAAA